MESAAIINKHDLQIDSLKMTLGEIQTNISVMINDHAHLTSKVDEILDTVKSFRDSQYKLQRLEDEVELLNQTLQNLQNEANETRLLLQAFHERITITKILDWIKKYWWFWGVMAPVLGIIGDILYKIDPK